MKNVKFKCALSIDDAKKSNLSKLYSVQNG